MLASITMGADCAVAAVESTEQHMDMYAREYSRRSTEYFQTAHALLSTGRALLHF
jgi:hypothetical protein